MARQTADERRETVLAAALAEFGGGGLEGTSTETIAKRAGISQPYLFRLYPTKKALFIATIESCFERVIDEFERAAKGLDEEEALTAMGDAYRNLLTDRELLLCQLQAYAACADPDVRAATRKGFRRIWAAVSGLSGASNDRMVPFIATGMLLNVAAAMQLDEVDQDWAQACTTPPKSWLDNPAGD